MHASKDGSGTCDGQLCTICFKCDRCSFRRKPPGVEFIKHHAEHRYESDDDRTSENAQGAGTRSTEGKARRTRKPSTVSS